VSKDRVTSVLRAPFTRYTDDTGYGEVEEEARGTGLQRAMGELLICQYCVAQWIAAGMVLGHAVAPRETRVVAATFTVFGVANALNVAYSAAQDRA
jgi:predicted Kef-type K+ transport protein